MVAPSSRTASVKKTKIVATVGPACSTPEMLVELVQAGVNVFRLNMAHGNHESRGAILAAIREAERTVGRPVGVLADLSGPKIRVGKIDGGGLHLELGATVRFVRDKSLVDKPTDLTTSYKAFFGDVKPGDIILLADGAVRLKAVSESAQEIACVVEQGGAITSNSGINLPGVKLSAPALTEKDLGDVRWIATREIDYVGLSFVRSPGDVVALKAKLKELECDAGVIAKIEKPQALEHLDDIVANSDAVMVARGDLGVEVDIARIAGIQRRIISTCRKHGTPVITATQMLESMRTQRIPTRAEATDVAHAIFDGTDATMLSAETAVGDHPVEVVRTMSRIAAEAESLLPDYVRDRTKHTFADADLVLKEFTESAAVLADRIGARFVIVASNSGRTACAFSKVRSKTRTISVGPNWGAIRQMCLYWGIEPKLISEFKAPDLLLEDMAEIGLHDHTLAPGDRVLLVDGENTSTTDRSIVVKSIS